MYFRSFGHGEIRPEETPKDNALIYVYNDKASYHNEKITIRLKNQTGEETMFKVMRITRMAIIFATYAARKRVCVTSLRFLLDGELINPHDNTTVEDLALDEDDQLDVMLAQNGC